MLHGTVAVVDQTVTEGSSSASKFEVQWPTTNNMKLSNPHEISLEVQWLIVFSTQGLAIETKGNLGRSTNCEFIFLL